MLAMLLCSHADFSASLKRTAEMICGEIDKCETLSLNVGGSLDGIAAEVKAAYDKLAAEGDDVVCLCDLPHASPYNACLMALAETDARLIAGMSLPLVLNIASGRDDIPEGGLDDFLAEAVSEAKEVMTCESIRELMAD